MHSHSTLRHARLPLALLSAFLLLTPVVAQQAGRPPTLSIGGPFPPGSYANLNAAAGGPAQVDLAQYLGKKPIILYYWIPDNGRSEEMFQELQELVGELGSDRIVLLGVAVPRPGRDEAKIRERLGALQIRVPVLNDVDYKIGTQLRVKSVPNVTLIDGDGRIRLTNGASLNQILGYKLDLGAVIRTAAETGQLMSYGYLDRYFPVRELEGQASPDFKAPLLDGGGERSWSQLLDDSKLNVLIFWSVDCPHCRKSLPEIDAWLDGRRAEVNIVSSASAVTDALKTKTREFCKESEISFPTLVDEEGKVGDLYRITSTPTILIIGPDGVIDSTIVSGLTDFAEKLEQKTAQLLGQGSSN